MPLLPVLESLYATFIEIAAPDHYLVGIADVVDRRHLATRKLFTVLMGQHLQLEFGTISAALGTQPVDTMQLIVAHPGADLLLWHRPLSCQQFRSTFARLEALDDLKFELSLILLHETP